MNAKCYRCKKEGTREFFWHVYCDKHYKEIEDLIEAMYLELDIRLLGKILDLLEALQSLIFKIYNFLLIRKYRKYKKKKLKLRKRSR